MLDPIRPQTFGYDDECDWHEPERDTAPWWLPVLLLVAVMAAGALVWGIVL